MHENWIIFHVDRCSLKLYHQFQTAHEKRVKYLSELSPSFQILFCQEYKVGFCFIIFSSFVEIIICSKNLNHHNKVSRLMLNVVKTIPHQNIPRTFFRHLNIERGRGGGVFSGANLQYVAYGPGRGRTQILLSQ